MTQRRTKRTYSEEQKKQLVELYKHGKPRSEIIREYDLTASAFDKWVKRISATGLTVGCFDPRRSLRDALAT